MKDSITHDAAHRLELSCQDAKQGKNDSKGNCIVSKANWLIQLDSLLQFIMSHFRYGHNHTQLHNIARENNEVFLEFNLFSETRFVEHSYRTYDHFVRMFHLLYEKLKRDEAARERIDKAIHLQNTLVVVETVLDLIFMRDLSHLLTYCSKEFQRFDVLPFYPMDVAEKFLSHITNSSESFYNGRIPEHIPLHTNAESKRPSYIVRQEFEVSVNEILETKSFKNVELLLPSEKGRVTRSGSMFGYDKAAYKLLVDNKFLLYGTYLGGLATQFVSRFHPWPKWLISCGEAFSFNNGFLKDARMIAFDNLLDCPAGQTPLLDNEKQRLKAEFLIFTLNVPDASATLNAEKNSFTQTELWYKLLTNEEYYSNCHNFIAFAVRFLYRTINETIAESEVSSLEDIETKKRHLEHDTSVKRNFISTNGPHPLVSLPLVKDFLNAHFGKDWHFTRSNSKWYVSKVVDRHFHEAKMFPNSLG